MGEPDETWSAWSADQTDPATASTASPPGRFIQYRVKLSTTDPRRTPELRSVSLELPHLQPGSGDHPARRPRLEHRRRSRHARSRLSLRWDASDPNDDDLNFTLKVRKEGWPEWIRLTDEPITEKTFAWDTTAFPSGSYRLKLIASDRPSNSPDDALTRERESLTFIVDHDPPSVDAHSAAAAVPRSLSRTS